MITITISNKIYIEGLPPLVARAIKKGLTLPNPLYFRLLRMGKTGALYNIKENFKYYEEVGNILIVGKGNFNKLITYLNGINQEFKLSDRCVQHDLSAGYYQDTITLRGYQKGDPESIGLHQTGVIRLGTGYGKTIIAAKLIGNLRKKTLIIVPRTHLCEQFSETFVEHCGTSPGIIQGAKRDVREVTIASIQTLSQHPEIVKEIKDKFGMVIVDECHTMITDKRLAVIQSFESEYLYGMTATARRTDQQDKAIFFTFGDVIIDKDLDSKKPSVILRFTDTHIPMDEYAEMINTQIHDEKRNELIAYFAIEEYINRRKILILTKRVEHYQLIAESLNQIPNVFCVSSSENQKDRLKLMKELREGTKEFDVILGTYSMLATGTDIPALDTLIFAGDLKSDVLTQQSVGRILRLFKDKQDPKIIDMVDQSNPILYNQARERHRFYTKQKWL